MTRTRKVRAPLIAIEGRSGAGKSTLARALGRATAWPVVREAYDRLRPSPSLDVFDRGRLLRLELLLLEEECRRYVEAVAPPARRTPVVLDTGFLGPLTYSWGLRSLGGFPDVVGSMRQHTLDAAREGRWGMADLSVYLDAPPAVARERSEAARGTHPERWETRHRAVGSRERRLWVDRFPRLIPDHVVVLDARTPLAQLVHKVRTLVHGRERASALTPESAVRVVRSFRASRGKRPSSRPSGNR